MKKSIVLLAGIILFSGLVCQAFAADATKIGVVNFQKIMVESSAGKMAQKQLREKKDALVGKLNTEKKELDDYITELKRQKLVLTPESTELKTKEEEAVKRIQAFQKLEKDSNQEFKQMEFELINKTQNAVTEIANKIGKEQGFLLILEKNTSGVIYHPERIDITDEVIKLYNLEMAKIKQ